MPGGPRAIEQERLAGLGHHVRRVVRCRAVHTEAHPDTCLQIAATGASPEARRMFEVGQWATPVPVSPIRPTSSSATWTAWAHQTSGPAHPDPPRTPPASIEPAEAKVRPRPQSRRDGCACRPDAPGPVRAVASSDPWSRVNGEQGARTTLRHRPGRGVVEKVDDPAGSLQDDVVCLDDGVRGKASVRLDRGSSTPARRGTGAQPARRLRSGRRPGHRPATDSDGRRQWCNRTGPARPARCVVETRTWSGVIRAQMG